MATFLARMVMPRSRSSGLESSMVSCTWLSRKLPLWRNKASTSVVFPWSTWAMIATFRMSFRTWFIIGSSVVSCQSSVVSKVTGRIYNGQRTTDDGRWVAGKIRFRRIIYNDRQPRRFALNLCGPTRTYLQKTERAGVDGQTIEAARRGDRQAQARLLNALQDVWYRFTLSQLRNSDVAADATQETALRFLKQLSAFRGDSQLQTWSVGIALNVVREMKRKRTFTELDDHLASVRSTEGSNESGIEHEDETVMLKAHLNSLPDRQREAI